MFCTCAEHRVDNREMFLLLLEEDSHRAKAFSAFGTATLLRKLGMLGRLAGDTAGTSDSN